MNKHEHSNHAFLRTPSALKKIMDTPILRTVPVHAESSYISLIGLSFVQNVGRNIWWRSRFLWNLFNETSGFCSDDLNVLGWNIYLFRTRTVFLTNRVCHSICHCLRKSPRSVHILWNYLAPQHSSFCISARCHRSNEMNHASGWAQSRHFPTVKALQMKSKWSSFLPGWWL